MRQAQRFEIGDVPMVDGMWVAVVIGLTLLGLLYIRLIGDPDTGADV